MLPIQPSLLFEVNNNTYGNPSQDIWPGFESEEFDVKKVVLQLSELVDKLAQADTNALPKVPVETRLLPPSMTISDYYGDISQQQQQHPDMVELQEIFEIMGFSMTAQQLTTLSQGGGMISAAGLSDPQGQGIADNNSSNQAVGSSGVGGATSNMGNYTHFVLYGYICLLLYL